METEMTVIKNNEKKETKVDRKFIIAVYGSLREGLSNHRIIKGSKLLGTFDTQPEYNMYSVGGSFPALLKGGHTSIVMEVYEVDSETLSNVDSLEGYFGDDNEYNYYNRGKINTPYGEAFYYLYNDSVEGLDFVEGGDWARYKQLYNILNK